MENQCSVKYIFQLFESRTVLQPILAALWETEVSLSTAKGAQQKGQAAFIAALFHLEKCPSGREVMWAMQSSKCGGETSMINSLGPP